MFGFFEEEKKEDPFTKIEPEALRKVTAINQQTISNLEELVQRITGQASEDQADAMSQRRFLDALRREGKGPSL